MKLFILASMLFCHIVDDYYLQGVLSDLKQKNWWKEKLIGSNLSFNKYKNDWMIALAEHAFSWSFMVHLPIALYMLYIGKFIGTAYALSLILNTVIHCMVDNMKANKLSINLVIDQLIHISQVLVTWMFCVISGFI